MPLPVSVIVGNAGLARVRWCSQDAVVTSLTPLSGSTGSARTDERGIERAIDFVLDRSRLVNYFVLLSEEDFM
jgi:hypothetical protein